MLMVGARCPPEVDEINPISIRYEVNLHATTEEVRAG